MLKTLFFSKEIITLLYGNEFHSAILPLQILLIGTIVMGIVKAVSSCFPAIGRPDINLKIVAFTALVNIILECETSISGKCIKNAANYEPAASVFAIFYPGNQLCLFPPVWLTGMII